MNRKLNYNQLYYFYVIASLGSIKDACEKLHLTQPTISGQLKALEEDLGYQLFDRKYRKLQLNEEGKQVYGKIAPVFISSESLLKHKEAPNDRCEVLRVGITKTIPKRSAIALLRKHDESRPNIKHAIYTEKRPDLIDMLKADRIDVIFSDSPFSCPKTKLKSVNLGRSPLVLVANAAIPDVMDFQIALKQCDFIHYTEKIGLYEDINMYFSINDIRPNIAAWCDDPYLVLEFIKSTHALGIVPKDCLNSVVHRNELKVLGEIHALQTHQWAIVSSLSGQKSIVKDFISSHFDHLT